MQIIEQILWGKGKKVNIRGRKRRGKYNFIDQGKPERRTLCGRNVSGRRAALVYPALAGG